MARVHNFRRQPDGFRLSDRLAAGPLPSAQAVRLAIIVAEALKPIHLEGKASGTVHPSCIYIDGRTATIAVGRPDLSTYTAPEEIRGERPDARTDIFAVGVLLYRMLSGVDPFHGTTQQELRNSILHRDPDPIGGIPAGLGRALRLCLEKTRERRLQHLQVLLAELKLLSLSGVGSIAPLAPVVMPTPVPEPARSEPAHQPEAWTQPLPAITRPDAMPEAKPEMQPELKAEPHPEPVATPPHPVPSLPKVSIPKLPAAPPTPAPPEDYHLNEEEEEEFEEPESTTVCPRCLSHDVQRSRPRGSLEKVMIHTGVVVWRCHRCYHRFAHLGLITVTRPSSK